MEEFWREANLVAKLRNHSNIVQFFGVCLNPLCVITEFLEGGDLKSYLDNLNNQVDNNQKLKWIKEIALGNFKQKKKKPKKNFFQTIFQIN